jgi:hypothetical protein
MAFSGAVEELSPTLGGFSTTLLLLPSGSLLEVSLSPLAVSLSPLVRGGERLLEGE